MNRFQRPWLFLLLGWGMLESCRQPPATAFQLLAPAETGVQFINKITVSDTLNILETEFVYNGGGVAVGDVNGDGLEDLFFAGNQVDNALFLNRGDLRFEDISEAAGVRKSNPRFWSSGVNILDINRDGRLDIYVCNTLAPDPADRRNLLYVNQGNDDQGVPAFLELGRAYGVADTSHSSHAQFFDYDLDGDLDLFVGVNVIEAQYPNNFIPLTNDGANPNRDRLFRNDWNDALSHPVFTDVSLVAGLLQDGYSHSTLIHDFNGDGWPDIYVANDYQSNDLILVNNRDGTFTDRADDIFRHFSFSAMGSDVGDINNDGAADLYTTEMQPFYNKRKKLFQGGSNYQHEVFTEQYGYLYQYTRNTLQLHRGSDPASGLPLFSEIAMYAQVQETDWSWAPLFADFDNDGWTDLFVSNGFPKDVTDHDFGDFRSFASRLVSYEFLYHKIPEVKLPNFLFRNNGDLSFRNVAADWGLATPSFSNGAAYADLDNDGDLDLVTNNIDDPAFIFENRMGTQKQDNYLRVKLRGSDRNPDAFGASVEIKGQGHRQKRYLLSARGYLSKSENTLHFGLGTVQNVDTLLIVWPDGKTSIRTGVAINQALTINYQDAGFINPAPPRPVDPLFLSVADRYGLLHRDEDTDFVDFDIQRTLPHKFSQYGPSIAVGDVTGDGLEDVFIGAGAGAEETWLIQGADGRFQPRRVNYKTDPERRAEDAGSLLFDADGDGDLDLYLVRGSGQFPPGDALYQDVLWINDGAGRFSLAAGALPEIRANGSCVRAADFDGDGDLDLFVGSRVLPRAFPLADRSYLLRNDSEPGRPLFTDVTEAIAPGLVKPGLISDALWTDFDGDHRPDLILAAEWAPLAFFHNESGQLVDATAQTGLSDKLGWWNSLAAADLDLDGDMDYVAGNFGENLYFRCTADEPIRVYGQDLDGNGMIDPLISCYWPDSLGVRREYLYHPRQDLIKQFVGIRKKYNTYGAYGEATVPEMFSEAEMAGATILSANWMRTVVIENQGGGRFAMRALPVEAQLAPVYGILPFDGNADGRPDLLLVGNDFGMETIQGRADAFSGLVLLNRGGFDFAPLSPAASGFTVPGDGRGLVRLASSADGELVLATQNRAALRAFALRRTPEKRIIPLQPGEVKAIYYLTGGGRRLEEHYWGHGFMAQTGRYVVKTGDVERIEILDGRGRTNRVIE